MTPEILKQYLDRYPGSVITTAEKKINRHIFSYTTIADGGSTLWAPEHQRLFESWLTIIARQDPGNFAVDVKDIFKVNGSRIDSVEVITRLLTWYGDNSSKHLTMYSFFGGFRGRTYYEEILKDPSTPRSVAYLTPSVWMKLYGFAQGFDLGMDEVAYWSYIYATVWLGHHQEPDSPFSPRRDHADLAP